MSGFLGGDYSLKWFPRQKLSDSQKTKKWYKENIEACISMVHFENDTGIRPLRRSKLNNYNLVSNIIDPKEIEKVINPFGIEYGELADNYRNCPIINTNLNVLIGEERKRFFNPVVSVVNSDAISQKQEAINDNFNQFLIGQVTNPTMNEDQIQAELQKLDKWSKYTYRDKRERMASQITEYLYRSLDLKEVFSGSFEDLLISGEDLIRGDIIAGEPTLRRAIPLNIYSLRGGESNKIEDSEIIVEDVFMPIGAILDDYHEYLTPTQIDSLERGSAQHVKGGGAFSDQLISREQWSIDRVVENDGIGGLITDISDNDKYQYGSIYDDQGNVRVSMAMWKGMRKIGILKYWDEDNNEQEEVVDENYKANIELGEIVEWRWISEWYEGTRIGMDIYVKLEARAVQMRSMDNLSKCHPGIVGVVNNFGNRRGISMVDLVYDYQLLINATISRLEMAVSKDKGKMSVLPLHLVPDGWDMDKWLYFAEMTGWAVVDPFNEGQKGAATGKLAGTMGTMPAAIDSEQGRYIQQQLMIIEFLTNKINEVTGITPQRKGAVENRETVGGVERAVIQSSHSTEKWFGIHDNVKIKSLKMLLEMAKVAWKGKSFKKSYVLDDQSIGILDYNDEIYNEAEYGIDISTASSDQELMQTLKGLAQPFMQNGGSMSMVMELFRTKNPASLQRKLEMFEETQQKQAAEAQAQAEQAQAENTQRLLEDKEAERELKRYEIDQNNATKIQDTLIKTDATDAPEDKSLEYEKLQLQREKQQKELKLNEDKLSETRRSNIAKETIARKKPTAK